MNSCCELKNKTGETTANETRRWNANPQSHERFSLLPLIRNDRKAPGTTRTIVYLLRPPSPSNRPPRPQRRQVHWASENHWCLLENWLSARVGRSTCILTSHTA